MRRSQIALTLHEVVSVLVEHQEHVRDLGTDRGHVVGVKVLLDDLVDGKAFVQHESGRNGEKNVGSVDGLLDELEGDEDGGGGGVDSGTDQDQSHQDTDQGIANNDDDISGDSKLVHGDPFGDLVGGLLRQLPFDEDPSHGDGGVDGADDGDDGEDTGGQGGTTEALSSLFQLLHLLLVHGLLIRHLDELLG